MARRIEQQTIITEIRDLERRLSRLERFDRDDSEFYDTISGASTRGWNRLDSDGNRALSVDGGERGLVYPSEMTQWAVPSSTPITSGTFTTIVECELQLIQADVIQFSGALIVPVGTTAEVRIYDNNTATAHGTQSIAGLSSNFVCEWLHPFTVGRGTLGDNLGLTQGALIQYQVRRTAGAGTISAWTPRSLMIRNNIHGSNESATTPFVFT